MKKLSLNAPIVPCISRARLRPPLTTKTTSAIAKRRRPRFTLGSHQPKAENIADTRAQHTSFQKPSALTSRVVALTARAWEKHTGLAELRPLVRRPAFVAVGAAHRAHPRGSLRSARLRPAPAA